MRIFLTGAGGAAAISVWKSLAAQHEIYMADMDPCAAGLYLVPPEQRTLLPAGTSPQFVTTVREICRSKKIELLIPTVDAELIPLALAISDFNSINTQLLLSPPPALITCRDKLVLLNHCKTVIPIPVTQVLNKKSATACKSFPCFAKPRIGAGAAGIKLINTATDLTDLPLDESYLIQEFLPGEEYSVDVYINRDGVPVASVPRLRMKIDSGVAVAARTVQLPELEKLAIDTALHVGIRYVANIQFKQATDGSYKLLEINPRFPGTLPLTAAAGIDIPQLLINDALQKNFPEGTMSFNELMVVRYWTEHFYSPTEWETLCQA